jgi:hypothetical protein
MRWLSASTSANRGTTAARISGLSSAANVGPHLPRTRLTQPLSEELVNPRAALTSIVVTGSTCSQL